MNVHATQPAGRHVATFLQDGVEIVSTLICADPRNPRSCPRSILWIRLRKKPRPCDVQARLPPSAKRLG
jgi:hypothetical protein